MVVKGEGVINQKCDKNTDKLLDCDSAKVGRGSKIWKFNGHHIWIVPKADAEGERQIGRNNGETFIG